MMMHKDIYNHRNNFRWKASKLSITLSLFICSPFLVFLVTGCMERQEIPNPTIAPTQTPTLSIPPSPSLIPADQVTEPPIEAGVLTTPTPAPTVTPSPLDMAVDQVVDKAGIRDLVILGLSGRNLVNFLVSALIVILGGLAGELFVKGVLWITRFTPAKKEDQFLKLIAKQLKWLIYLFLLQLATVRLAFLSAGFKQWASLIYFALFVLVICRLLWILTNFVLERLLRRASSPQNRGLLTTFSPLLRRTLQGLIAIIGLAIVLHSFGVNLSALLAVLGLGGLAVSLAAKETLEDLINGFIILIDRPFQIGDRIKIESMDAWGTVEDIGARTTRIRTLDNRLVIVPNSVIGRNQVETYSFPDPSVRIAVKIGIAYGSDIDQVLSIIAGAVQSVPHILQTKPPLVEFAEFGDSAMIFQAVYWLESLRSINLRTEINKAIYQALVEASIEMPFITYDVNLSYKNPPEG
jgi:MscS family membrane protein